MPDLITSRFKLKDIFPDIAPNINKTLIKHDIDPDNAEYIRKGIVPRDMRFEDGENAVVTYITTNTVDRDHEIVESKGALFDDYLKNPVVMWGHDYYSLPIGKCVSLKKDNKGIIAKTVYYNKGMGQEVFDYRKAGFPLAESIGFIPLEWKYYDENDGSDETKAGVRRRYTKWEMLEYSDVSVPSNPEALMLAVSKGLVPVKIADIDGNGRYTLLLESEDKYIHFNEAVDKNQITQVLMDFGGLLGKEDLDTFDLDEFCEKNKVEIFEKSNTSYSFPEIINEIEGGIEDKITIEKPAWDETEVSFRYRVRSPGLFRDDTMRTVSIKKDKPKVNAVMGKLKKNQGKDDDPMILQSLIFPKSDDWTLDKAKAWLKEHDELMKEIFNLSAKVINELVADGYYKDTMKSIDNLIEKWDTEDDIGLELKVGRELSAKNIRNIKTAVTGMESAVSALRSMLKEEEPEGDKTISTEDNPSRNISLDELQELVGEKEVDKKPEVREINQDELRGMFKTASDEIATEKAQKINEDNLRDKGIVQIV